MRAAKPAIGQPHNARKPLYNYSTGIEAQLLSASAKLITHSTDSLLPDELLPLSTTYKISQTANPQNGTNLNQRLPLSGGSISPINTAWKMANKITSTQKAMVRRSL